MRGLLPPDKQHQAEDRALEDAEEEAEIFETEVLSSYWQVSAAAGEAGFFNYLFSILRSVCYVEHFNV